MEPNESDKHGVKLLARKMDHVDLNDTNIVHETGGGQPRPLPIFGSLENAEQVEKKQIVVSEGSLKINMIKHIQDPSKVPSHLKDSKYHCQLCNRFFAEMKSVQFHIKSEGHVERFEQNITDIVVKQIPNATAIQLSAMTTLVEELYTDHSAEAKGQTEIRKWIVTDLEKSIKPLYKDLCVDMFGSSKMGCALTTSDVNLNVNIEETDISHNDIPNIFLHILKNLHTQDKTRYRKVQDDFYSPLKIPRILFQHTQSKLTCELRIGSYAPTQVASLIELYCQIDPRVSKLCVAMKYWAKVFRTDTHVNGHYPSVVFVLMVLHYLQQTTPPVIPVLHEEVSRACDRSDDGNDEAEFEPEYAQLSAAADGWQSSNTQSSGELLHGLLRYYVLEFDQNKYAVTIRQSEPLLRQYRDGWGSTKLAVEDPFLTKSNISRAAGSDKVYEYLVNCFKLTYLHVLQVNKKINKLVSDITRGTMEELPAADEEGDSKEESDEHDDEMEQEAESNLQHDETKLQVVDEEKKDAGETGEGAGQGVEPNPDDESKNGESIDDTVVRNVTEEILQAEIKEKGVSKKTNRKRRYVAQIMKALDGIVLNSDEKNDSYRFKDKDFKTLFKTYPEACLLCRRARHTAMNCPDEVVPKFNGGIKWPPHNSIRSLTAALQSYTDEVMLRPDEQAERNKIRNRILQDIHTLYPKASLELFGSSANQFGHCNSDLDLCLLMNEKYECEKVEIIEKLAKHFKKISFYRGVSWIASARVPIIKLSIDKWAIDCDISMENCLALQNTKMLSAYASIDTRVRTLGYTVKSFAKVCDMCDASSGSISSYGYILMLIHFLQQLNILPVLQKLPPSQTPSGPMIDGWNCYYFSQLHDLLRMWRPENSSLSPAELWLHFLLYYSRDFDWKHNVVTIKQKEPLSKFEKSWTPKPMAIEDPFNHDHNLAQAVSSRMRTYILKRFQKAILHHQKPELWKDIDEVMKYNILCGDYKAPKFTICDKCNRRGHRGIDCLRSKEQKDGPNVIDQKILQNSEQKSTDKTKKKQNATKDESDSTTTNEKSLHKGKSRNGNETKKNGNETKKNGNETKKNGNETKKNGNETKKNGNDTKKNGNDTKKNGNEFNKKGDLAKNQSSTRQESDNSFAGKSRSQIRQILLEQTGGSIELLKKCQTQLKAKAHSSKGTSIDKKSLSVLTDLVKKLQKEQTQPLDEEDVKKTGATSNDIRPTPLINKQYTRKGSSSSSQQPDSSKHGHEQARVFDKLSKTSVPQNTTGNYSRHTTAGPTVIVRPKIDSTATFSHPSPRPPLNAVPHSSYPLDTQHQMVPPHPHTSMSVPLLPSPTTPQYPLAMYSQSPPTTGVLSTENNRRPLIDQPPLITGNFPPSHVSSVPHSLLPNPNVPNWSQQHHPQWYPPPRGY